MAWRERQPERDIFVLADRLGNLAAASWIGPRHYETDTVAVAATLALGGIRLYHGHTQLAKQFLQVTQAYAYRRYDYVKQGILMQVSTLPLIRACAAVGYRPLTSVGDHRSGNLSLDMVVSSGPLAALNIGKYVAMPQRPERPSRSAKPYLRIVKEDMGD